MKKIISIILAFAMIVFNTGCTVKKAAAKHNNAKRIVQNINKTQKDNNKNNNDNISNDNSNNNNVVINDNKNNIPQNNNSHDENNQNNRNDVGNSSNETTTAAIPNDYQVIGWGLGLNKEHKTPSIPDSWKNMLNKYNGMFVGDTTKKEVYLTFDEGYEAGNTGNILDILKNNNVKAAFFVTGHFVDTNPDLVKRMVKEGHVVGNHTENHPSLPTISDEKIKEELSSVQEKVLKLTDYNMKYVRPPKGEFNERTMACINSLGYKTVFWSFAMADWQPLPGGPDQAYNTLMEYIHPGSIILLHAISKDDTQALDKMIKSLKSQGYTFKSITDIK